MKNYSLIKLLSTPCDEYSGLEYLVMLNNIKFVGKKGGEVGQCLLFISTKTTTVYFILFMFTEVSSVVQSARKKHNLILFLTAVPRIRTVKITRMIKNIVIWGTTTYSFFFKENDQDNIPSTRLCLSKHYLS